MSEINPVDSVYPLVGRDGVVGENASARLEAFFEKMRDAGLDLSGEFYHDVRVVMVQKMIAVSGLNTVEAGRFSSCEHEPQYAGGVESPGNRIFTPPEGVRHILEQIRSLG